MSTNAIPGIGAYLNRWDDSSTVGVWDRIVEVIALAWDGPNRGVIEVFKLDATDEYVNKLQGVLNAGSITATVLYTRAQFKELKSDVETRGNRAYQVVLPDGAGLEWDGFITELPLDIGSDAAMQGEVVIEIDGACDFVSSAG